MGKFRVGDVAIAVCPKDRPDVLGMNGTEVTIVGPLRLRRMVTSSDLAWCYLTNWPGRDSSYHLQAKPEWLRRKEDKVDWSNCVWQPEQEPVSIT